MKKQILFIGLILIGIVSFSIWSLPRFPSISVDEIGISAISDHYLKTGRILYPLFQNVVDPKFSFLTGLDDLGMRAPYFALMGMIQKMFGNNYLVGRGVSLSLWILIAFLVFIQVRREDGLWPAMISLLFLAVALDGFILSHLIRYDIFILLFYVFLHLLVVSSRSPVSSARWFWAGFIGPVACIGFHPNGLLVVGAVFFLFFLQLRDQSQSIKSGLMLGMGLALGAALSLIFIDLESFVLAYHSMSHSLLAERGPLWKDRLIPWNLIGDIALYFLKPGSFYVGGPSIDWNLWKTSAILTFFVYLYSAFWVFLNPRSNPYLKKMAWLFIFSTFALGLGAARQEFIYRPIVTVSIVPVLGFLFVDSFQKKSWQGWMMCLASAGIFWIFRTNLIFFLVFFLVTQFLLGVRDKIFLVSGLGGLLGLFCVWARDKDYAASLLRESTSQWTSPLSIAIFILCAAGLFYAAAHLKDRKAIGKAFQFSFLFWFLIVSTFSLVSLAGSASLKSRSLNDSFKSANILMEPFNGKILGPSYFWFWKPGQVEDIGGIVIDYLYSGQKRAGICIERVKPDILIIDNEFKRRYLLNRDPITGHLSLNPLSKLIPVPVVYLGSIPESFHHTNLELFKLDWSKNKASNK